MAWESNYLTSTQFKNYARITDDQDDTVIAFALAAASRAIDRYCSQNVFRQFGLVATPEARYYTPRWDDKQAKWVIEIDDIMTTTGLTVEVDTTNDGTYESVITDYALRPRDALLKNRPYTQISVYPQSNVQPNRFVDSARITGQWGWTTVPTTVEQATFLQVNRIHARRDAPFEETGSPQRGTRTSVNLIQYLDPDIEKMLEPYIKLGWTM